MVDALVAWFQEDPRPLPWRRTYDPYQVWISEVMLQQTQVATALPYFERFIKAFPNLSALANAEDERVLKLWAGLGYYSRARNLMRAARLIVERHNGQIPADYDQLLALPGIGRYMAGAILSIAFNKPYPVVDGNVRRVLSRVYGWEEERPKDLWDAAARLAAAAEPRFVNQALMELGSRVCSFRSPRCPVCPLQKWCAASKTGMQDRIPPVKKRPDVIRVSLFAIVHKKRGRYLMKPADGMWEFPTFTLLPAGEWQKVGACRHTITHHRLDVSIHTGELPKAAGLSWKAIENVAITSLTRKILTAATRGNATARLGRRAAGVSVRDIVRWRR